MYIEKINGPEDVKKLNIEEMAALAEEMRHALLKRASIHGGHFGPNFGMVEAIIALHYVFESPKDKMVFDVSHQTYPHKMLTGRKDAFLYEEHYDDVSGYSNPHESEHDHFTIGHTSTSVSLACGLAKGRDLKGEDGNVVAIIGDGSLSGGEALEALNYAAELERQPDHPRQRQRYVHRGESWRSVSEPAPAARDGRQGRVQPVPCDGSGLPLCSRRQRYCFADRGI